MTDTSTHVNIDMYRCVGHDGEMSIDLLPSASSSSASACCTPAASSLMNRQDAETVARTLKALADPARLRLLSIIAAQEGTEACVCDLTEPVGLSQPTASHHMKVLADAGLVTREKRGVWVHYTIVPGAVEAITGHLTSHLSPPEPIHYATRSGSVV